MKHHLTPTALSISLRADGGARLMLTVQGRDTEVELSPQLWSKLGEDARWFAAQTEVGLPGAPVLFDHEALLLRVAALEGKVAHLLQTSNGHANGTITVPVRR